MKMKKFFSATLAMMLACSAMSGCLGDDSTGGPASTDPSTWESLKSGETVQITFAGRDVETERVNYEQFVSDFNSQHSNIVATLDWTSDTKAYNITLSSDKLPDVFMLSNAMFIRFAAQGKLANIRDHLDTSVLNDMYEDGYEVYYFDHETKTAGKTDTAALYGLPKDQGPYALCINEDLLKSKVNAYNATASDADDIDIDKVLSTTEPMTFSYFLEIGKKLKTVMGTSEYVCSGYDLESAVYSNNANFFTDDSGKTAAVDSENFIGAMEFIQDLYKEGILPDEGTVSSGGDTVFTGGRSIFYYAGPWQQKDFWKLIDGNSDTSKRFTWNILPVLCGDAEGAVSTAYIGGMCYAISNDCKYKDAALELVKFLAADTASQRTQYKRGQCIPNLKSLATEFANDSQGLIANTNNFTAGQVNPKNRSVWVDVVNGTSATDKVTGKYRAASYTWDETWQTVLNTFMAGSIGSYGSFWSAKNGSWVDIGAALKNEGKELVQTELDILSANLEDY